MFDEAGMFYIVRNETCFVGCVICLLSYHMTHCLIGDSEIALIY